MHFRGEVNTLRSEHFVNACQLLDGSSSAVSKPIVACKFMGCRRRSFFLQAKFHSEVFLKQNVRENCKFGERFARGKTEIICQNDLRFKLCRIFMNLSLRRISRSLNLHWYVLI